MTPDPEEAERFLALLDPKGSFTFQTYDDDRKRSDPKLVRVRNGTFAKHRDELVELNAKGAGIFVTVNETDLKGRKKKNVVRVRAKFVDLDGAPLTPILDWSTAPHIIIESSPGRWHVYWLGENMALDRFEAEQKKLIDRFNGDKNVHDLPRVMRLPGFVHQKGEPFVTRIHTLDADLPPYDWVKPVGFEGWLSRLGNGPGRDGFNEPLLQAVAAYVVEHGDDIDRKALKERLRAEIDRAPKEPGRDADMEHYKSDTYLDGIIDGAINKGFGGIVYDPTQPMEMARRAEAALIASKPDVYRQQGRLVRAYRLDQGGEKRSVSRDAGALVLGTVTPKWLNAKFMEVARWRLKKGLPSIVAETYCEMVDEWKVPILHGTVETPTMYLAGDDYVLLQTPGYDPASRLIYDPGDTAFPPIPEHPTKADAQAALDRVLRLLESFPFMPDEVADDWLPEPDEGRKPSRARSVALSAWLTGLIRRSMAAAPLHAFDATSPGTGKSYLVRVLCNILTARGAAAMPWVGDEAEQRKRIMSVLVEGDPIVLFDNATVPIGGTALNILLSEPVFKDRILGKSSAPTAPTNCLVFATGNNLVFRADTTRRVIQCRMDARRERPQDRQFTSNPLAEATRDRAMLVTGGLTILLAYLKAGRPQKVDHVASYEDWSLIREALTWLGQPDPAGTMRDVSADDPESDEVRQMMDAWGECFGTESVKLSDAVRLARESLDRSVTVEPQQKLHEAMRTAVGHRDVSEPKMGFWFKRYDGKIVDGRRFVRRMHGDARHIVLLDPNRHEAMGVLNRPDRTEDPL